MFNPPHAGHIELARAALGELGLECVLLVPSLIPSHKPVIWDPGADRRAQMCRLASSDESRIKVCTVELERPGPSYTVDTLRSIHDSHPDAELTLILGADMAATLDSWREPGEIVGLARVAVAQREGVSREQVMATLGPLGASERADFLTMSPRDISSSQVRRALTSGQPIEPLVGAEVAAYINEHELYGRTPATSGSGGGA
ncbi:MAG TPA: nicotinate (nicotinamide) nucleotide adenylyltransferase [Solirubrobacteraceae bacterium]|jgi:nicotinate-nucleotide adenylyltransferase|nr:nicotinate (nicotinamide) nucleotide adenylyltransferase [Solirubrobacteraceae bacterium]